MIFKKLKIMKMREETICSKMNNQESLQQT